MIKGLLDSKGVYIREGKVTQSLKRVDPQYCTRRSNNTVDRTNQVAYYASGFGHNLHLDQNKKLVIFGVTYVLAVDGYSGIIVSHVIMPVKNNLLIYEHIYRKAVFTYGLGEQIRVDYGRIDPLLHGLETSH
uniref:Integrase catalytic domain-containing protein n=1 Tax=Amphimedon queenslandica TaxID=400682 RepID=A0A1X7SMD5_AMPQE